MIRSKERKEKREKEGRKGKREMRIDGKKEEKK